MIERKQPPLTKSLEYRERGLRVIPGGSSCYSRAPISFVQGVAPVYAESAKGCVLTDVDGNQYLDFTMGLCPVMLGHAHPQTLDSLTRHMTKGTVFTLPHRVEVELAEKIVELVPCAEKVRFGKNGSDATAAAVRLSRSVTGRDLVALCGYHGWQDFYIGQTDQNGGVPQAVRDLSLPFRYNDADSLAALFRDHPSQIACVLLEPMSVIWPEPGFLETVRELCRKEGAILVFDEVITGFRWSLGGAQEYFGVTPDLACFSKALANGLAISALAGKAALMDRFTLGGAFWSTTYGNEALTMAVALDTLNYIQEHHVVDVIWRQGQKLMDGFAALLRRHGLTEEIRLLGSPPRHVFSFQHDPDLVRKSYFQQECILRGLLSFWCHNVSLAHGDAEIGQAMAIYDEVLAAYAMALADGDFRSRLVGEPVRPVFTRTP